MKGFLKKQSGFNLIELMVVIAIFGIMVMYATPFFQETLSHNDINTAKSTLITTLNKAKRIASAENSFVNVELENNKIELSSHASGLSETHKLPGNITFSDAQSLMFGANGVITTGGGNNANSDTQIHIQHSFDDSLKETVSISTTGLVAAIE